ncbi:MAG: hypothetical protein EA424_25940 [Planctomycetaceae bacterium]|nr:MAG: hypothetical protein EA424_25940 [Planctomycetaceae bacterium]
MTIWLPPREARDCAFLGLPSIDSIWPPWKSPFVRCRPICFLGVWRLPTCAAAIAVRREGSPDAWDGEHQIGDSSDRQVDMLSQIVRSHGERSWRRQHQSHRRDGHQQQKRAQQQISTPVTNRLRRLSGVHTRLSSKDFWFARSRLCSSVFLQLGSVLRSEDHCGNGR